MRGCPQGRPGFLCGETPGGKQWFARNDCCPRGKTVVCVLGGCPQGLPGFLCGETPGETPGDCRESRRARNCWFPPGNTVVRDAKLLYSSRDTVVRRRAPSPQRVYAPATHRKCIKTHRKCMEMHQNALEIHGIHEFRHPQC